MAPNIKLIATPFRSTTAVPVDLALLKARIFQELPTAEVKALDLNIRKYRDFGARPMSFACVPCGHFDCPKKRTLNVRTINSLVPDEELEESQRFLREGIATEYRERHPFGLQATVFNEHFIWIQNCLTGTLKTYIQETVEHDAELCEEYLQPDLEAILDGGTDIAAIHVFHESQLVMAFAYAKVVKKRNPDVETVLYGPNLFSRNRAAGLIETFGFLDHVIPSDPASPLIELARMKSNGKSGSVAGLVSRGHLEDLEPGPLTPSKEVPHADFSDFDLDDYFLRLPVLPIRMTFGGKRSLSNLCDTKIPAFVRSAASVVEELGSLREGTGTQLFSFADSLVQPESAEALADELIRSNLDIRFRMSALPVPGFTLDLLRKLWKSGCRDIQWPLESLDPEIRERVGFEESPDEAFEVIKRSKTAGIYNGLWMIHSTPGSTSARAADELKYLRENLHEMDEISPMRFWLETRSQVHGRLDKLGIKVGEPEALFNTTRGGVQSLTLQYEETGGMTHEESEEIQRQLMYINADLKSHPHLVNNSFENRLAVLELREQSGA